MITYLKINHKIEVKEVAATKKMTKLKTKHISQG